MGARDVETSPWGMFLTLRKALEGAFDGASEPERERAARDVVRMSTAAAGAVALEPVPFVDSAAIFSIHHWMSKGLGRLRGHRSIKDPDAVIKAIRRRLVTPHFMLAASKFVPFAGDLVAFAVAYALTEAIGEVVDRDYRTGCRMTRSQLIATFDRQYRDAFELAYKVKRDELSARFRRAPAVKKEIEDVKKAMQSGRIGLAEGEHKMEQILREVAAPDTVAAGAR
jgi:uncharacterized protein (DUF697 family)